MTADLFTYKPKRLETLMPEDVPIDVCTLFDRLAKQVWDKGIRHYSADAILHRIRWEYTIEKGDREFKANDHWTAPLARWFLANHPDKKGFFALRKLKEERDAAG